MSLVMHDLYKYNGTSIFELFNELKQVRQEYVEDIKKDMLPFIPVMNNEHFIAFCKDIYNSTAREERGLLDIGADAVIYPYNNEFYVQFFHVPYRIIGNHPSFADFFYDGRIGQPIVISKTEWEHRENTINSFLTETIASRNGFVFIIVAKDDVFRLLSQWRKEKIDNGVKR